MTRQRMLAQLVSHSGGTPQVLSSTPCGSEFQAKGKKNPLAGPVCQSTGCEPAPGRPEDPYMAQAGFPWATAPSVRAGPGFGDFLGRGSRVFSQIIPVGRSFPTRPSFFFVNKWWLTNFLLCISYQAFPNLRGTKKLCCYCCISFQCLIFQLNINTISCPLLLEKIWPTLEWKEQIHGLQHFSGSYKLLQSNMKLQIEKETRYIGTSVRAYFSGRIR